ncbi:Na/Pi cotransporter family protein [Alicyclobacillus sp. ALC3]|uniref:Na/Pi cotransporter family protein n=1 Tax=Alicyclobacillus sp. ALC3 TaxID=2796143 RepID=UPI002379A411|nr:Na/Pi symporter [Alicyclobacillus sp. ALC3]WDL96335.1 Na/Pi cotransporter family protein [Alicyclobacillus sp. ALC3]
MTWNFLAAFAAVVAFISALRVMRTGLEGLANGRLPQLLRRFAGTPTRGIITGTALATVLQSSSAVTAITVGLVAGGNLLFRDAVGVVLGANVGTTLTPQLLTFPLWNLAVPCLAVSIAGLIAARSLHRPTLVPPSLALAGFAGILISLQVLVQSLHPVASMPWFANWLETAGDNPWLALLTGVVTSAMLQSSTATTVITMALSMDGLIPIEGAIAIVLGANVGTCVTSVIAAIGQPRSAGQVALAHVLLNVAGAVLGVLFLEGFGDVIVALGGNAARQVANAHTVFNIVCTLLAWPFIRQFSALVEWLLPDKRRAR